MAITIKELAKLASTSRGTVDRVLNNRGKVNPELRDRIIELAEQYNYKPNSSAQLLVASHKNLSIGVVVNSLGNPFYDEVVRGIHDTAKRLDRSNIAVELVEIKGYDDVKQVNAINSLLARGINALAISAIDTELVTNRLSTLREQSMPIAFINSDIADFDSLVTVGADNHESGHLAGNLTNLTLPNGGKVAVVTGSHNNIGTEKRIEAYKATINKNIEVIDILENYDSDELSNVLVAKLITNSQVDLLYFCSAGTAGGLRAIDNSRKGIKAITVDINDTIKSSLAKDVTIATITQDPYSQGTKGIQALADYLVTQQLPRKRRIHTENKVLLKCSKGVK